MTDSAIKKTGDLSPTAYKPNLKIVVSDPDLAALPDGNPLKQSKNMELGDILAVSKNWNVTPTVNTEAANPIVIESLNCIVDSQAGTIALDTVNAPPFTGNQAVSHVGVARTNTNISSLKAGEAGFIGLETSTFFTDNSAGLAGIFIGSPDLALADIENVLFNGVLGGGGIPTSVGDYVISMVGKYATESFTLATLSIKNDINTTQPAQTDLIGVESPTLIGSGNRLSLLLNKETNSLSVGYVVSTADETQFNVIDAITISDNPTLSPDSVIYIFFVGINFGFGMPTIITKPVTMTGKTAYNVAGTTYATDSGNTQLDWDAAFPHLFAPLSSTVYLDTVLPAWAFPGALLTAIVDEGYVSNYIPKPYGKEVPENSLVIVTNTDVGSEDFIVLCNLNALTDLSTVVSGNTASIAQLTASVSSAAKLADLSEIVMYVVADNDSPVITASSVFNTFDEAYEYALTLPGFLKKRIILDDRFGDVYEGQVDSLTHIPKKYMLMTYNITLSTLSAYTDGNITDNAITFRAYCDGLRLVDFEGYLQTFVADPNLPSHHVVNLSESFAPSLGARFNYDNFLIGKNTRVYSNSNSVLDINGGTVVLQDNAIWFNEFIDINNTPVPNPIVITKSQNSKLTITGSKQPYTSFTSTTAIQIVTSRKEFPTVNAVTPANAVAFYYTDPLVPELFVYDGYTVIRSLDDLILNSNQVSTNAFSVHTGKYWIVGEINIGSNVFFIQSDCTFVGTHGSKIKGLGTIFSNPGLNNSNNAYTLTINGVDFESDVISSPTIRVLGNLNIQNSKINSVYPLLVIGSTFLNTVKVKNCSFGSENKPLLTALSITRCKVFIDSIRAHLNTSAKLLSFEGGAAGRLDMHDVVATYEGGQQVNSYLIDIGNVSDFYASGDINISNVEVIANNTVLQQHRYSLFGAYGSPYDVSSIIRYNVDILKYYAGCRSTSTTINSPVVSQNNLIPISFTPDSINGQRGFQINSNLLTYVGKTPLTFIIDAVASYLTVTGSAVTSLVVTKNGGTYDSTSVPASTTVYNEQARIKCPVTLKYGDTLGFNMVNATNTNPFTRFNISVSLTES